MLVNTYFLFFEMDKDIELLGVICHANNYNAKRIGCIFFFDRYSL